jgi:hypothetical protein
MTRLVDAVVAFFPIRQVKLTFGLIFHVLQCAFSIPPNKLELSRAC